MKIKLLFIYSVIVTIILIFILIKINKPLEDSDILEFVEKNNISCDSNVLERTIGDTFSIIQTFPGQSCTVLRKAIQEEINKEK